MSTVPESGYQLRGRFFSGKTDEWEHDAHFYPVGSGDLYSRTIVNFMLS